MKCSKKAGQIKTRIEVKKVRKKTIQTTLLQIAKMSWMEPQMIILSHKIEILREIRSSLWINQSLRSLNISEIFIKTWMIKAEKLLIRRSSTSFKTSTDLLRMWMILKTCLILVRTSRTTFRNSLRQVKWRNLMRRQTPLDNKRISRSLHKISLKLSLMPAKNYQPTRKVSLLEHQNEYCKWVVILIAVGIFEKSQRFDYDFKVKI